MGVIYEQAYAILSASAASNGDMGLFAPMERHDIIKVPCDRSDTSQGHMYFSPGDIFFKEDRESPLNSRGWVAQERLLSRRTISFAPTQVYWECLQDYTAENKAFEDLRYSPNLAKSLHYALSAYKSPTDFAQAEKYLSREFEASAELNKFWRQLIRLYSKCQLTFQSDKIPALEGLVTQIKHRTLIEYHYGHFFDGTVENLFSLLWISEHKPLTVVSIPRAPSWSWASLDGPLEFMMDDFDVSRCKVAPTDMKIIGLATPDPNDDRKFPYLKVTACIKPIKHCPYRHEPDQTKTHLSPYPKSAYYDLGSKCHLLFNWHSSPSTKPALVTTSTGSSAREDPFLILSEMHSLTYPQADLLPPFDPGAHVYNRAEYGKILAAPDLGWIMFDAQEVQPEEVELALVCRSEIQGQKKSFGERWLALALVRDDDAIGQVQSMEDGGMMRRYKRVGVAQVHRKGWFEEVGTRRESIIIG